jgi:hypothetical protein
MLRDALEPIFAQVPAQAELFDHGLVPGDKPRLFVDIVSFVEMARDRRCYRFIQDTRGGTIILAESEKIDAMTQEIANYLARRLIEREKVLSVPYYEADSRLSVRTKDDFAGELTPQAPAAEKPHKRGVAGWQLLATFLVGAILGAALAYAYKAGQFEHLWPIRW